MPAVTKNELHANIGTAWKRAVELWETYVVNESWTITTSCTYTDGVGCFRIVINDGTDTTTWNLVLCDIMDGASPAVSWWNLPGWTYSPGVKLPDYGSRNTKTDFNAKMVALRRSAFGFFSTGAALGSTVSDDLALPINSANARIWHYVWKERMNVGLDKLVLVVADAATDYTWFGERAGNEGELPASAVLVSAGGSGAAPNLQPIVDALEDIATQEVDVSINNSAAIWSMRSRVRTS